MIPRDYVSRARPHGTDDPWWLAGSCGKKKQGIVVTGLNDSSVSDIACVCGAHVSQPSATMVGEAGSTIVFILIWFFPLSCLFKPCCHQGHQSWPNLVAFLILFFSLKPLELSWVRVNSSWISALFSNPLWRIYLFAVASPLSLIDYTWLTLLSGQFVHVGETSKSILHTCLCLSVSLP